MSEQECTRTRFHSKPQEGGTVVMDAWNDDCSLPFCPKLDAANGLRDVPPAQWRAPAPSSCLGSAEYL